MELVSQILGLKNKQKAHFFEESAHKENLHHESFGFELIDQ